MRFTRGFDLLFGEQLLDLLKRALEEVADLSQDRPAGRAKLGYGVLLNGEPPNGKAASCDDCGRADGNAGDGTT